MAPPLHQLLIVIAVLLVVLWVVAYASGQLDEFRTAIVGDSLSSRNFNLVYGLCIVALSVGVVVAFRAVEKKRIHFRGYWKIIEEPGGEQTKVQRSKDVNGDNGLLWALAHGTYNLNEFGNTELGISGADAMASRITIAIENIPGAAVAKSEEFGTEIVWPGRDDVTELFRSLMYKQSPPFGGELTKPMADSLGEAMQAWIQVLDERGQLIMSTKRDFTPARLINIVKDKEGVYHGTEPAEFVSRFG